VSSARILVVDDDADVRRMLLEYLGAHGYEVTAAANGGQMRTELERQVPDVVLLDVGLPGEDGLSLARYLRERHKVGIIMVTAADCVVDRVVGLEIGADDYVAKPFDPRELRAAQERAAPLRRCLAGQERRRTRPRIGRCTLDVEARRLLDGDGADVAITAMEFDLLKTFVEHPNKVLTRDRLLTLTRNREWEPFDRSIDIRIARLRRKIELDPDNPLAIQTIRGAGYMFVPPVD
jgi:two-component system phosphate regulon response regulator OmpR